MFSWANQNLVDSIMEFGYYTDNQIFAWANKTFLLLKFGWLYQLFWLIQPNTMVNLRKRFAQANNNFIAAVNIIIFFIMNLVIKNSNNNILLKKKEKNFETVPKTHCSRLDLNLRPSSFLPTYLS